MPREFSRARRVAASIKRILAPVLATEARELGLPMLTLTGVDVAADLKNAVLHVSCLASGHDHERIVGALVPLRGRMRHQLAGALKMRTVPQLTIRYDDTPERGARISALLDASRVPARAADEPSGHD